ncbi:MAG: hypothetical protein ACP5G2_07865, partial [Candidatus Bipolaricaulaceae bacterium]
MRTKALLIGLLAVVALSATAFGFDAFFADAQGNKIKTIWEGGRFHVVVHDPEKGACGLDEFTADLVVFDFKTGAYIQTQGATLREFVAGSANYFWVNAAGNKIAVKVGDRKSWTDPAEMEHVLDTLVDDTTSPYYVEYLEDLAWTDGNWIYIDEDVDDATGFAGTVTNLPQQKEAWRAQAVSELHWLGRFENMDTLILILADETDERNIDQDQVKIVDTVAELAVNPGRFDYGCGGVCDNITVTINDPDENLNCDKIDYVPFFVIINPGSWNQTGSNFCSFKMYGGYPTQTGSIANAPIRWYNVYDERWMDYSNAPWLHQDIKNQTGGGMLLATFNAHETDVDSGVFEHNFGNVFDFTKALNPDLDPDNVSTHRFPSGTTVAFYYLDPNDFDDFTLTTCRIGDRPYSETYITDANGIPVEVVKIGHAGLYVRVYDADANVEACCQDSVVVHLCDPHNEDDSEYWEIDEVSNDSGIFASMSGMPLLPVWDAVGGYQLVFDSWTFETFNEDTIFARYNSVVYEQDDLNLLGDGNANDGAFPPAIDTGAPRYQPWDVSFDLVKVYDYQVYDGDVHHMRFLNGSYEPIEEIPVSGSLYLEVTDLDQNESPLMRELVFGGWNKDADPGDLERSDLDAPEDNEDSAPIWELLDGDSDRMTPQGAVTNPDPVFL